MLYCFQINSKKKKMGIFDFFKKQSENQEAEEVVYEEYEEVVEDVEPVDHIEAIVKWRFGGPDPLDGVDVYDAGDSWHLVSYGLSELYEKLSEDPNYSGYGFEFTMRLKETAQGIYARLGSDLTDYGRQSLVG